MLLLCVMILIAVIRVIFYISWWESQTLPLYAGESGMVEGVVVNDPEHRATSTHVNLKVSTIDGASVSGTMLVILPREATLEYGDTIQVSGGIGLPAPFETDTGRIFDYAGYLQVQGVSTMMQRATLLEVTPGGWSLQKTLFELKHYFEASLERIFPEPDNSLLEGVLLGERRGLPQNLNDAFIASGLVHVVVLSGYNISIVSNSILYATSFLPATLNYGIGSVFIILFAVMSGAGATTVRACAMGLVAILARYLNRPASAMRALLAAAFGMGMWNPPAVIHDPSFILSVLATFGLIALSSRVEKYLQWLPERFGVRSIAASTISVQIYVLPTLLYLTGILSFIALPANILALPVIPFAMLMGFLAGIAGFIHPALGLPFGIVADLLLKWMMLVAGTAYALPFSSTVVAAFPAWIAIVAYIPLTWVAVRVYRMEEK